MCGCGHNLCMILRKLRLLSALIAAGAMAPLISVPSTWRRLPPEHC
jgi:hypothetical protein